MTDITNDNIMGRLLNFFNSDYINGFVINIDYKNFNKYSNKLNNFAKKLIEYVKIQDSYK